MMTTTVTRTVAYGPNTKHYEYQIRQIAPTVATASASYEITRTEYVTFPNGDVTPAGKSTYTPSVAAVIEGAFCWVLEGDRLFKANVRVCDIETCKSDAMDTLPEYDKDRQAAAYRVYIERTMATIRRQPKRRVSSEERSEMRAAFGSGANVTDVITGRKFRT